MFFYDNCIEYMARFNTDEISNATFLKNYLKIDEKFF